MIPVNWASQLKTNEKSIAVPGEYRLSVFFYKDHENGGESHFDTIF
jgi:hypothetical protein